MKIIITAGAFFFLISTAAIAVWFLSGRDLQSLSDGLSREFRAGARQAFKTGPKLVEMEQSLRRTKSSVRTRRDAYLYSLIEQQGCWELKRFAAIKEIPSPQKELQMYRIKDQAGLVSLRREQERVYEMAHTYHQNGSNCKAELRRGFPYLFEGEKLHINIDDVPELPATGPCKFTCPVEP